MFKIIYCCIVGISCIRTISCMQTSYEITNCSNLVLNYYLGHFLQTGELPKPPEPESPIPDVPIPEPDVPIPEPDVPIPEPPKEVPCKEAETPTTTNKLSCTTTTDKPTTTTTDKPTTTTTDKPTTTTTDKPTTTTTDKPTTTTTNKPTKTTTEKPSTVKEKEPEKPPAWMDLPSGYIKYKKSYYKYHKKGVNFGNAVFTCDGENSHLAILNSFDEAKYLGNLMNKEEGKGGLKRKWAYIGFHDYFKKGQFLTILGQALYKTRYMNWAPGQPDNSGGNENCGSMNREGLLNDLDCRFLAPFICEREILPYC